MMLKQINKLTTGQYLSAHWANNKGRGRNNCTLSIIAQPTDRGAYVRDTIAITQTRTSSWNGNVNLSKRICTKLGIEKTQIIVD